MDWEADLIQWAAQRSHSECNSEKIHANEPNYSEKESTD